MKKTALTIALLILSTPAFAKAPHFDPGSSENQIKKAAGNKWPGKSLSDVTPDHVVVELDSGPLTCKVNNSRGKITFSGCKAFHF